MKIYYIPFGLATMFPVTVDSISDPMRIGLVHADDWRLTRALNMIDASGAGSFDGMAVRAKFEFPDGRSIFIDNRGGVLLPTSAEKSLNSQRLTVMGRFIMQMTQNRT